MLRQNSLGGEEGAARSWHALTFFIGPRTALLKLRLLQNNISGMNKGQSEARLDMTGFVVVPDHNLKHELETSLTYDGSLSPILRYSRN